jgi:hypothetical protein
VLAGARHDLVERIGRPGSAMRAASRSMSAGPSGTVEIEPTSTSSGSSSARIVARSTV